MSGYSTGDLNKREKESSWKWSLRAVGNLIILPVIQGMFSTLGYFLAKYRILPLLLNRQPATI